MKHESSP